jgi:hypothetical protein
MKIELNGSLEEVSKEIYFLNKQFNGGDTISSQPLVTFCSSVDKQADPVEPAKEKKGRGSKKDTETTEVSKQNQEAAKSEPAKAQEIVETTAVEATKEAPKTEGKTPEDVKNALALVNTTCGIETAKDVLKKFECAKMSDVVAKPEIYAAFIKECEDKATAKKAENDLLK